MARCKINYTSAGEGFAHFERRGSFKIDGGIRPLCYFICFLEICSGFQLSVVKPKQKKVITLANHKGHRKSSEPIKTVKICKYNTMRSAGKHVRTRCDWFYF